MNSKPDNFNELLNTGVAAAKNGQADVARPKLRAVLAQEPNNVPAMLWLAFIAEEAAESLELLEKVLAIEPENEQAKSGLKWASSRLQQSDAAEDMIDDLDEITGEDLPNLRQQLLSSGTKLEGRKSLLAQRARRNINPLLVFLMAMIGFAATSSIILTHPQPILASQRLSEESSTVRSASIEIQPVSPETYQAVDGAAAALPLQLSSASDSLTLPETSFVQFNPANVYQLIGPPNDKHQETIERPLAHQPKNQAERWIEVDISEQQVTAWEGDIAVMSFLASTGKAETPTVLGRFNIYWKLEKALMVGDDYYLPDVPYTMYFHEGYGIHGTYWHDSFGQPITHGCVNLRPDDAKQLFEWTGPTVASGSMQATSSGYNPGTLVVVHE